MYVEHRLELTAICPVDKKPDVYECVVEAARVVPVEDILRHAKELAGEELYQEDLCQELHRRLACKVTLLGSHSGVRTKAVCGR